MSLCIDFVLSMRCHFEKNGEYIFALRSLGACVLWRFVLQIAQVHSNFRIPDAPIIVRNWNLMAPSGYGKADAIAGSFSRETPHLNILQVSLFFWKHFVLKVITRSSLRTWEGDPLPNLVARGSLVSSRVVCLPGLKMITCKISKSTYAWVTRPSAMFYHLRVLLLGNGSLKPWWEASLLITVKLLVGNSVISGFD